MRTLFRFVCLAGLTLIVAAPPARAYQRYNAPDGTNGCNVCHGAFTDGTSTKGSVFPGGGGGDKHTMHRSNSYMSTSCNLCHTSTDDNNPFIGSSDGVTGVPGLGCTGCHGRNEDMGHDTQSAGRGAGLRQHHFRTGTTVCASCHTDANPSSYTPVAESVNPPYYGTTATKANKPCNSVAAQFTNENWTVGAPYEGSDNDGNNLYDNFDVDCVPFRMTAIARVGNDIQLTWQTLGGTTNVLQICTNQSGNFSTNFTDVLPQIVITGAGPVTTNRLDSGGATNSPSRYYRLHRLP